MTKKPITVPARIIHRGEPIPGEDIALLKMVDAAGMLGDSFQDKFICLVLGDSDKVHEGSPIQAIGYPGLAFNERLMEESARYVPSFQNGQIGASKRMRGGWSAFEITAQISWGYSGGPVVDRNGNVVALNVGTATPPVEGNPIITGHNLAVPINVAKKYLAQKGVQPVLSPISAKWEDGLKLYSRGCYAEEYKRFDEIHDFQFEIGTKFQNKTVLEMLVKAKKQVKNQ